MNHKSKNGKSKPEKKKNRKQKGNEAKAKGEGKSTPNEFPSSKRLIGATALTTGLFIASGLLIAGAVSLYLLKPNCADASILAADVTTVLNITNTTATTTTTTTTPTTTTTTTTAHPLGPPSLDKISKPDFRCGVSNFNYEQTVFTKVHPPGTHQVPYTPIKFWPWVLNVLLWDPSISKEKRYFGAASLVSPRHAITSLNFKGEKPTAKRLEDMLSVQSVTPTERNISVAKARFYHFLEPSGKIPRDLILLTLETEMDSTVTPVCLPSANRKMPDEAHCLVLGQANSRGTRLDRPALKRCGSYYERMDGLKYVSSFCASHHKRHLDICYASSGAPFTCGIDNIWVLYGIEEKRREACGKPHMFTMISHSMDWICCYMKEIESCKSAVCAY